MSYIYPPEFPAHDPRHGTRTGYVAHKCRCEACRKANAEWQRQRRSGAWLPLVDPRHGTVNGYINYDFRCQACTDAGSAWNANQYRARKTAGGAA